jgi:hypothetical protein
MSGPASKSRRQIEPGLPPEPEPIPPSPGPDIPPRPEPGSPPGEPPLPRPGDPVPEQSSGLEDPRHLRPGPADLSPGVPPALEVEPLSGPTEAST